MKIVIYKAEGIYYTTTEKNYAAGIQDARAIHKMESFSSAEEIIEYYCKYFRSQPEDFIIIDEAIHKYRMTVEKVVYGHVEVTATSREEAIQKALAEVNNTKWFEPEYHVVEAVRRN